MKHVITLVLVLFALTVTVKAQAIDSVGSADQEMIFDGAVGYGPVRAYPHYHTAIKFFDGRACTVEVYQEFVYVDRVTREVVDTVRAPVEYYDYASGELVSTGQFLYDGDPKIQRIAVYGEDQYSRIRILTRASSFPATKIMVSW